MKKYKEIPFLNSNKIRFKEVEFVKIVPTALTRVYEPKHFIFGNMKPVALIPNTKPLRIINSQNNIPKKNMNWIQAKTRYPKLNPFGDADRDGVINMLDCKPFNKYLQDPKNKHPSKDLKKDIKPIPFIQTRKQKDTIAYRKEKARADRMKKAFENKEKKVKTSAKPFQFTLDEDKKIGKSRGGLVSPKNKSDYISEIMRLQSNLNRKEIEERMEEIEHSNLIKQKQILKRQEEIEKKIGKRRQTQPHYAWRPAKKLVKLETEVKGLKFELRKERKVDEKERKKLADLEFDRNKTLRKAMSLKAPPVMKARKERFVLPSQMEKEFEETEPIFKQIERKVYPSSPEALKEKREAKEREEDKYREAKEAQEIRDNQIVTKPKTILGRIKKVLGTSGPMGEPFSTRIKEAIRPNVKGIFSRRDYKELYQTGELEEPVLIETPTAEGIVKMAGRAIEREKLKEGEYYAEPVFKKSKFAIKTVSPEGYTYFQGDSVKGYSPKKEEKREKILKEEKERFEKKFAPYEKIKRVMQTTDEEGKKTRDYYETKQENKKDHAPIQDIIDLIEKEQKIKDKETLAELRQQDREARILERKERKEAKKEEKETKEKEELFEKVETKMEKKEDSEKSAQELINEA